MPRTSAVAAMWILLATGLMLAACDSDDSDDAGALTAKPWVLTSAVDNGVPIAIAGASGGGIHWRFLGSGGCDESDPTCPDGPKLLGNDFCNDFTRSLQIDDGRATWGDFWVSTAVGCSGGLADTLSRFLRDKSFLYVVTDDQLRLTSSDGAIELTLEAST